MSNKEEPFYQLFCVGNREPDKITCPFLNLPSSIGCRQVKVFQGACNTARGNLLKNQEKYLV